MSSPAHAPPARNPTGALSRGCQLAVLCEAARATRPGLWLAALVAGVMAETALHEAGHAWCSASLACGRPAACRCAAPLGASCRPLERVPRPVMLASLMAPQVVVPALLLPLGAALGEWPLAVLLRVLNVAGSAGGCGVPRRDPHAARCGG